MTLKQYYNRNCTPMPYSASSLVTDGWASVAVLPAISGGTVPWRARGSGGRAPSGVQVLVRGQAKPPEAEALLVFRLSMEAANLPTFLKFGNANKSHICVIFAKNYGWPRNWGLEQNWGRGLCPPAQA